MTDNKAFVIEPTYRLVESKDNDSKDSSNGSSGSKQAIVHLWCRLEDGRSALIRKPFKPYFFIKKADVKKARNLSGDIQVESEDSGLKGMDDKEPVSKITTYIPSDVVKLRESFEKENIACYEADIRFAYRAMMDWDVQTVFSLKGEGKTSDVPGVDVIYDDPEIKPCDSFIPKLATLSFDIESNKDTGEIFCLSSYGTDNKGEFRRSRLIVSKDPVKGAKNFPTEKELIEAFRDLVIEWDPDVITGWNVIDFDLQLLHSRAKHLKVPLSIGRDGSEMSLRIESSFFRDSHANIKGRVVLDGIQILKNNFIRLPNYKLATAAKKFTKDKKLIEAEGIQKYEEIVRLYEEDKESLLEYNFLDAKLAYDIIKNSGALDLTIKRSLLVGMPLDRVSASIATLDSLYLRKLRKRGFVAPSVSRRKRDDEGMGGFVMKPKAGIYDYVIVCDFKSLYPSIMRTFNIDPLMFEEKEKSGKGDKKDLICAPNGACFRREEGIIPELIRYFWDEREKARKAGDELARYAIKIHMNSIYGVLASPNGRFFNRKVGNAITSFAQKFIKLVGEETRKAGYEVIYGDSVSGERYTTILNEKGFIEIVSFEDLFLRYKKNMLRSRGKDIVVPDKEISALSMDKNTLRPKFSPIKTIIRHRTKKTMFHMTQKYGSTEVTRDHSLVDIKNNKLGVISPERFVADNKPFVKIEQIPKVKRIRKVDLYGLLKDYKVTTTYKGREKVSSVKVVDDDWLSFGWTKRKRPVILKRFIHSNTPEMESFCRLLGLYIAEGSSSTIETTDSRFGANISSSDRRLLGIMKRDYMRLFRNTNPRIIESDRNPRRIITQGKKKYNYNDKTLKLQMMNAISAVFFKMLSGQKSHHKKIPEIVFHLPNKYKRLLLEYMLLGDGSRFGRRYSDGYVKEHFSYSTSSLQLASGLTLMLRQLNINFNMQYRPSKRSYRISSTNKNNSRLETKVEKRKVDGYVYDLSVKDENFTDACGQVVLHNTDSIFIDLKCDEYDEAQKLGKKIENKMNRFLEGYIKKEYDLKSYLELEFEKTFIRFVMPKVRGSDAGAKKRYAGLVRKDDGSEEISFTGLEMVRRDWTDLAKDFQYELYRRIFAKEEVSGYVKKFIKELKEGKFDDKLIYRKSLRKSVEEYTKTTPPHVKAAMKLDRIESNLIEYVITTEGPEPVQKIIHKLDYEHYIEKQLKPIADSILSFYDTSFDDLVKGNSQSSLFDY